MPDLTPDPRCPLTARWPRHAPATLQGCTCPEPARACYAWPTGRIAHLLTEAGAAPGGGGPALVAVPCPAHDRPGHMFTGPAVVDLTAPDVPDA